MTDAASPEEASREPLAREGEHVAPERLKEAFHCPYCGVLAQMEWEELR